LSARGVATRPRATPGEGGAGSLADAPIGVVPIIWNNADLPPSKPPLHPSTVLDEIERLGFAGTQLGVGFPTGDELRRELSARHLRLAEVYGAIPCQRDGPAANAPEVARRHLDDLVADGGEVLVVALERSEERDAWVGRAAGAPSLTDDGWTALGDLLNDLGEEAGRSGHEVAFHNHAGTFVETSDELDRLMASTDPRRVGLCLDVGHAIVGGGDPVAILARHGERVTHVHLKDVAPGPAAALREQRLTGFLPALQARVFAPLGSGLLDLPGVLAALANRRYRGWLMVEQDTSWEPPSEAAAVGRRVLASTLRWMTAGTRLRAS